MSGVCLARSTCCSMLGYQPEPCKRSTLAPLIGKDMRRRTAPGPQRQARSSRIRTIRPMDSRSLDKRAIRRALHQMTTLVSTDWPASSRGLCR